MQRYCDGCRRYHDLGAFDLDSDELSAVCRSYRRSRERISRAGARRLQQSKIEALEQQRRTLIAALVKIDQEIAKERALQAPPPPFKREAEDVLGTEGDLDPGD